MIQIEKKALVTIAIGREYLKIAKWTHPAMRKYAQKVGADFIVINSYDEALPSPHFAKYQLYNMLKTYERILYIDSDALIVSNCPDLFQLVPENTLGVFLEVDEMGPTGRVTDIQKICGKIEGWSGQYFNSGVMVLSSAHRAIFDPHFQKNYLEVEFEQAQLNWNAQKLGVPIFNIGKRFNHIVWELDASRYDSFIIHYVNHCPPEWLSRRHKIMLDVFILSWPKSLQFIPIMIRCTMDCVIMKLLQWTLPARRMFGLYNKGAG